MDDYDLSNLPLLGDFVDSANPHLWLTAEQNRRVTFSGRSATLSTLDQAELQQLSLTYEAQTPEQRGLTDFNISLLPSTPDRAPFDESEDPFASLAAYQSLPFDDDIKQLMDSNLSLFGDINASDTVLAEPEQPQGEFDAAAGIIIPESAIPDTISDKRSSRKRASEPRSSTKESIDRHVRGSSSRRSKRKAEKGRSLIVKRPDYHHHLGQRQPDVSLLRSLKRQLLPKRLSDQSWMSLYGLA